MYRLLGFKSVSNARLVIKRQNLIETRSHNVHLLFNRNPSPLTLPGELCDLNFAGDDLVIPQAAFSLAKISRNNLGSFFLAGFIHKCYSSSEPSAERLRLLTVKKKRKAKKYTELLQGEIR